MTPFIKNSGSDKIIEMKNRLVVARENEGVSCGSNW